MPESLSPDPHSPPRRLWRVWLLPVLLLALLLAGIWWQWCQARQQARALTTQQQRLNALEQRQQTLTESLQLAQEALAAMRARSGSHSWRAEEWRQSLLSAWQSAQALGNAAPLIATLHRIQTQTQGEGDLAPLRNALAADLEQLQAADTFSAARLAARLNRLSERVQSWRLLGAEPEEMADESATPRWPSGREWLTLAGWQQVGGSLVQALRSFAWLRVSHTAGQSAGGAEAAALLSPDSAQWLRLNLRLALLAARLDWLSGEWKAGREELRYAQALLARHFDRQSEPVREAALMMEELLKASLQEGALVEPKFSLRVLRDLAGAGGQP